jgi:LssY C-terminus
MAAIHFPEQRPAVGRWRGLLLPAALALLAGCGPAPPESLTAEQLAEGAIVEARDGLTVAVRALTDDEARRQFGGRLMRLGVQAVWIRVSNESERAVRYLPILTDPDYFAPQEVAQQLHGWFSPRANAAVDAAFVGSAMPFYVGAHRSAGGFVFTHADGGLKLINVGLVQAERTWRFRFVARIPGREYAVQRVDFSALYPPASLPDLTPDELHERLKTLPCCVADKAGTGAGDPLNLVVVGSWMDTMFPFAARGWRLNEPVDARSSLKMTRAFLFGSQYDTAPVSPLYLFGRYQDVAFQKARSSVSRRNHLRLWLAPFTCEHQPVWIGQISRDIGVKLTTTSWYLTTHRISPYVDEERDYLLQDLLLSGLVQRVGFSAGVGAAGVGSPRYNLAHDPYVTDGLRLVVFLGSELRLPMMSDFLPWERPAPAAAAAP